MATRMTCHDRGMEIAGDDLNVAADTAYCRACGSLLRPSQTLAGDEFDVYRIRMPYPPTPARISLRHPIQPASPASA